MNEGERNVVLKSGLQTIFGGYRKPMTNVASAAVEKISDKEEVRREWKNDPLMRNNFSPKEFVQLDRFLARGLNVAPMVKDTPVLFIQGTNDKLIRPAGTWKLFERLGTANRQMVLSKNSEHLIFEEGQFNPDDLKFVLTWIDRNIAPLDENIAGLAGSKKKNYLWWHQWKNSQATLRRTPSIPAVIAQVPTAMKQAIAMGPAIPPRLQSQQFRRRLPQPSSRIG